MTEKIYCSQCHHSVYVTVTAPTDGKLRFGNDKICLHCQAKGKFLPKNQKINHCVDLLPESVDKLLNGVWSVNQYFYGRKK